MTVTICSRLSFIRTNSKARLDEQFFFVSSRESNEIADRKKKWTMILVTQPSETSFSLLNKDLYTTRGVWTVSSSFSISFELNQYKKKLEHLNERNWTTSFAWLNIFSQRGKTNSDFQIRIERECQYKLWQIVSLNDGKNIDLYKVKEKWNIYCAKRRSLSFIGSFQAMTLCPGHSLFVFISIFNNIIRSSPFLLTDHVRRPNKQ